MRSNPEDDGRDLPCPHGCSHAEGIAALARAARDLQTAADARLSAGKCVVQLRQVSIDAGTLASELENIVGSMQFASPEQDRTRGPYYEWSSGARNWRVAGHLDAVCRAVAEVDGCGR